MTSHHDVAVVVAQLRAISGYPIFCDFGDGAAATTSLRTAADLLEAQAKALSEAEAEVDRLTKRLDLLAVGFGVPDGGKYIADWQTKIAKYKSALAAEARLAEARKVIEAIVSEYPSAAGTCKAFGDDNDGYGSIRAASDFLNAVKDESKDA